MPAQNRQSTPHRCTARWWTVWSALLILAVLCRAAYLWAYARTPLCSVVTGADVLEYDRWAREILARGVLWDRVQIHGPLYPLVLALFYRVTDVSLPAVRGIQLAVDVASLALVSGALARLGYRRAALWTAALWALYQPLIYYSAELYSEVVVVFCLSLALFFWSMCRAGRGSPLPSRVCAWCASAFCMGLAAVAHPLSLSIALPFCGLGAWLAFGRELRTGALIAVAATGYILLAAPIVPVAWRNAAVSGEAVLVQGNTGLNLWIGNNPEATGTCYVRPGPDYDTLVAWPAREGAETPAAATRFFVRRVAQFVTSHPLKAGGLLLRKLALTWNAVDITSGADLPQLQLRTWFMQLPLVRFGLVAPLAFAGLWLRARKRDLWPLALFPVAATLALALLVTSGRYRLMMMPGVLAAAGVGGDALWRAWRARSRRLVMAGLWSSTAGFALAFVPTPPPLPDSGTESALILAEAAWKRDRYEDAESILARAMALDPNNAAIFHLAGNVLADTGRQDMAVESLRQALTLEPERVDAYVDLGILLSQAGNTDEARVYLELARDLDPTSAKAWYNIGILNERAGRLDDAMAYYRTAANLDPLLTSAKLNAAILAHRLGQPADAVKRYRELLRLTPRNAKAHAGLALALAELGQTPEAVGEFERALELNPEQPRIWLAYAQFLTAVGRDNDAEDVRQRAAPWLDNLSPADRTTEPLDSRKTPEPSSAQTP
jgi:tetratricopeptide (TPR) repeat protein